MAAFLNELFFEPADSHFTSLMMSFAFCTTFVFRPVGALIFGWLGGNIGRKSTVIITTFMMAVSCFVMANLPTYAQIGVAATWIIIICRIVQGMTSMGEIVGAGNPPNPVCKCDIGRAICFLRKYGCFRNCLICYFLCF